MSSSALPSTSGSDPAVTPEEELPWEPIEEDDPDLAGGDDDVSSMDASLPIVESDVPTPADTGASSGAASRPESTINATSSGPEGRGVGANGAAAGNARAPIPRTEPGAQGPGGRLHVSGQRNEKVAGVVSELHGELAIVKKELADIKLQLGSTVHTVNEQRRRTMADVPGVAPENIGTAFEILGFAQRLLAPSSGRPLTQRALNAIVREHDQPQRKKARREGGAGPSSPPAGDEIKIKTAATAALGALGVLGAAEGAGYRGDAERPWNPTIAVHCETNHICPYCLKKGHRLVKCFLLRGDDERRERLYQATFRNSGGPPKERGSKYGDKGKGKARG